MLDSEVFDYKLRVSELRQYFRIVLVSAAAYRPDSRVKVGDGTLLDPVVFHFRRRYQSIVLEETSSRVVNNFPICGTYTVRARRAIPCTTASATCSGETTLRIS